MPTTNPDATTLPVGTPLTAAAALALETLEQAIIDGGGWVHVDVAEAVVHEFACVAQGSCSCREPRSV